MPFPKKPSGVVPKVPTAGVPKPAARGFDKAGQMAKAAALRKPRTPVGGPRVNSGKAESEREEEAE